MTNIKNETINKFLEEVAAKSPTPGGGAVAAVTGAMAAVLVQMVAALTVNKKGYEQVNAHMEQVARETKIIKEELLVLADEDSLAFEAVMKVYKIDKNDKTRSGKIKKALILAIDIPEKVCDFADKIIELGQYVAKKGNKNAYSDAMTALYLAKAAKASAMENIKINKIALRRTK